MIQSNELIHIPESFNNQFHYEFLGQNVGCQLDIISTMVDYNSVCSTIHHVPTYHIIDPHIKTIFITTTKV